jgi:sec-independent protein translocase protein TatA
MGFGVGHWELLLIAFVAFLLFGHRLPKMMGSVGQSLREFRKGLAAPADEPGSDA